MTINKNIFLFFLFLLVSCATKDYGSFRDEIIKNVNNKNYDKALEIVDNNYDDKNDLLLNYLEKGTLYYISKDYKKSIELFDKAEKLSEEQYTISITDKLKGLVSDSSNSYYSRKFELGLIRFYKSLIYYNLYKNSEEDFEAKLSYLRKSRSNIMKWNSLNNSYYERDYYNEDLLQKIWGSFIYKENEDSRAKTSLKSAENVLYVYNVFPTYNLKSDKFRENFFKLNKNDLDKLVQDTDFSKSIKSFVKNNDYNGNLNILFKEGFLDKIKIKSIKVPLSISVFADQSSDFISFLHMLIVFDKNPDIEIQLPYVDKVEQNKKIMAEIYDKNNKMVENFELLLVEPLNDIFYDDFEKNKSAVYSKLIASTTTKYITAITSAYQLYKTNYMFLTSAVYYDSVKKIIDKSSVPDTRAWSLLPKTIRFNSIKIKKGNYNLKIKVENNYIYEENIVVDDNTFLDIWKNF